jgi:hypothetical protein
MLTPQMFQDKEIFKLEKNIEDKKYYASINCNSQAIIFWIIHNST